MRRAAHEVSPARRHTKAFSPLTFRIANKNNMTAESSM